MLPATGGAAKLGHEQHVPANKVVSVHSSVQIVVRAVTTCRTTPPTTKQPVQRIFRDELNLLLCCTSTYLINSSRSFTNPGMYVPVSS